MLVNLSKLHISLLWALIALLGGWAAYAGYAGARDRVLTDLVDDAQRCAVAFEPGELRALTATRSDLPGPAYATVKQRLKRLRAVNPQVRFVYIFRSAPDPGKVTFLADSEPEHSDKISLPGDDYPQAAQSPGLQQIIRTGMPATEGPIPDDFGVWVTGYALVDEVRAGAAGGAHKDILGLDLDASDWRRILWSAALERGFFIWMLLGVPFMAALLLRRQLEQREAIRNLTQAVEQSQSAVMIIDLESCVEYANAGLCRQIGYSRRELIGRSWREFQQADVAGEALAEMVATVRSGQPWSGEWTNRRKDGSIYPVRGVITPVKNRDGRIMCYVGILDDMTEIKRHETVLLQARDRAEAGDIAKSRFLATMSHEVRTPLNGIIGFTSLLLDTPLNAEQREYVQTIRTSGDALMALTGDILDFARIETGKLKLDLQTGDPRAWVEETLDLFAARAAEKKIELLHWIEMEVPASISADSGRLRQVLANLVANAVKFTEAGEVEVRVACVTPPAGTGAATLEFSVRDTGIGIAPTDRKKLFKPFSQVDQSNTRRFGGTGLGLAISQSLVQLMGGEISLESAPGVGSTFRFTLPVTEAGAPPAPASLGGMRIALVGKPGAFRDELARLFARWEAQTALADSVAELGGAAWDLALVELDAVQAAAIAAQPAADPRLPVAKAGALVPLSLPGELRVALRTHFRLILNRPVHQCALFGVLSGSRPKVPVEPAPENRGLGLRVLIVEDNAVNLRLMQKMLASIGCTWGAALNGRLALEELTRDGARYDGVLMDLHMPELDGLTAIEKIRAGEAGEAARAIWISALTADARAEQRVRVMAAGADYYLTKPVLIATLLESLRQCAERRPVAKG